MVEVQAHGFGFEQWARQTFFGGYAGKYVQEWDIPADANQHESVPAIYRSIPVSIKVMKYGASINLSDALRQRQINADFLMLVGFWSQRTPSEKWIEEIGVVRFSPSLWTPLWGQLTSDHLGELARLISRSKTPDHTIAKRLAREWKKAQPEISTSTFTINPKIDHKTQRRVQCSLRFEAFWRTVGRVPARTDAPTLFDIPFPNPIQSAPRKFNR